MRVNQVSTGGHLALSSQLLKSFSYVSLAFTLYAGAIEQTTGSKNANDAVTTASTSLSSNQLEFDDKNLNEVQTPTGSLSRVACLNDLEPSNGTAWSSIRPGPPPTQPQSAQGDDFTRKVPPPLPQRPLDSARDSFSRPTLVSSLPHTLSQDPSPPR